MGLDFVNRQGRYIRNEREENYQEDDEIKDILDTGKIVDDEDIVIDENYDNINIEQVPQGWIGIYNEQN